MINKGLELQPNPGTLQTLQNFFPLPPLPLICEHPQAPYCHEPLGETTSGAEKLISEPEGENALDLRSTELVWERALHRFLEYTL